MDAHLGPPAVQAPVLVQDNLVRRLGARYVAVLAAVVALVLADQALIQPWLVRMSDFAPAINVAGRQRMLSQKLAKAALALGAAQDEPSRVARRAELREAVSDWAAAHGSLRRGNARQGIARLSSPQIEGVWHEIEPHFVAIKRAVETLGHAPALGPAEMATTVGVVVAHEGAFLRLMDRQVSLFEAQAGAELRRLRWYAATVAALIVALVCALGWFVIRPATAAIRGQVDRLESQVAHRTRKLHEMLNALRSEVAEREAVEERNRSLAAQLAHANRVEAVGHLAAGLAHELNQPFAAIVNYTEACSLALEKQPDEPARGQLHDYIERVRKAALRAGQIVRRIRDFVRPGPTAVMPVELSALVREVVEFCRPEAQRVETRLELLVPPGNELVVEADPIQIQQVLVNLIQNALHASKDAPVERRRVRLQVTCLAETVQVDVVDHGPGLGGIDPDDLFAPFRTTKVEGLGIGLSICRSIVEQHRGTIWAQSRAPHGAQFSFVLPRMSSHDAEHHRQTDGVCR